MYLRKRLDDELPKLGVQQLIVALYQNTGHHFARAVS